jgi:hypothetical protein
MVLNDNSRDRLSRKSGQQPKDSRWVVAEKKIGRLLTLLLLDGCLVLNDVPFPYGNLDHLVIKPDLTTFLIETKSHHGTVTWDGKQLLVNKRPFSSNPICQINRSIRWMRHMIGLLLGRKPWIVSILVYPNAKVEIGRSVKRVNVMEAGTLVAFIRNYPSPAK